jgi:hypothetical protein
MHDRIRLKLTQYVKLNIVYPYACCWSVLSDAFVCCVCFFVLCVSSCSSPLTRRASAQRSRRGDRARRQSIVESRTHPQSVIERCESACVVDRSDPSCCVCRAVGGVDDGSRWPSAPLHAAAVRFDRVTSAQLEVRWLRDGGVAVSAHGPSRLYRSRLLEVEHSAADSRQFVGSRECGSKRW